LLSVAFSAGGDGGRRSPEHLAHVGISVARNLLGELLPTQRIKQEIATAETEP
jgi:hypothetical protein